MAGRKTDLITFNLFDRGRKHTGQTRDNVDKKAWIDLINSPATQEMISTGSMLGYYGHQIRQLWGITPPESVPLGGKIIHISPALRTIEMTCDQEGNVTHRQEFLETPEGDFALSRYKAKVGGFSAAHDYTTVDNKIVPTLCAGMDFVLQPNYATNIGNGVLMDSVVGNDLVRHALEVSTIEMYDNIFQTQFAMNEADSNLIRAMTAENKLLEEMEKLERRKQLILSKDQLMYDSALCPTVSLDQYLQDTNRFLTDSVLPSIEQQPKKQDADKFKTTIGFFGLLG